MKIGDLARLSNPTQDYETWRNRVGVIRKLEDDYADFQLTGKHFALRVSTHRLTPIGGPGAPKHPRWAIIAGNRLSRLCHSLKRRERAMQHERQ
jgi:hypothetical protein